MPGPRIYLPQPLEVDTTVELDQRAAHHATRVLRLEAGDAITLFNGEGGEYAAVLTEVDRHGARARPDAFDPRDVESPLAVHLAQGVSRGDRMDYAVQKAVELGVARIEPLFTERCVVRLSGERLERRRRHWEGVAVSACEQCGRNRVPPVATPRPFDQWIAQDREETLRLQLEPDDAAALTSLTRPEGAVVLLVGPEGGLSPEERRRAREAGFDGLRLGPRTLRTETAGAAALAALQTVWGDLG